MNIVEESLQERKNREIEEMFPQTLQTPAYCRNCGIILNPKNWCPSFERRNNCICRKCWIEKVYEYWGKNSEFKEPRFCASCGVKLGENNQYKSDQKYGFSHCKNCVKK